MTKNATISKFLTFGCISIQQFLNLKYQMASSPVQPEQGKYSGFKSCRESIMNLDELLKLYATGERNFSGIYLHEVYLYKVEWIGANLSKVDLSGVNLSGVDLKGPTMAEGTIHE